MMITTPFVFLLICIHSTTGSMSSTVIRMSRGSYRFPVEYIRRSGEQGTVSGFASLGITAQTYSVAHPGHNNSDHHGELRQGFVLNNVRYEFPERDFFWIDDQATLIIPASRRPSLFGRAVSSFLLYPVSETEDELVLNPSNPVEYAFEGRIVYAPITSPWSRGAFGDLFSSTVRLVTRTAEEQDIAADHHSDFEPFGIDIIGSGVSLDDRIEIPEQTFIHFLRQIDSLGIDDSDRTYPPHHRYRLLYFSGIEATVLANLPSLEFIIEATGGQHVQIAKLDPIDYLVPTANPDEYWCLLASTYSPNTNSFRLTHSTLKNILIHFDYQKQSYWFCRSSS